MAKGPAKNATKKTNTKPPVAKAKPVKPSARKLVAKPAPQTASPQRFVVATPPPAPIPVVKPPAAEGVKAFERGMAALHRHDYKAASTTFQALLAEFPSEGFLTDRARVYLGLATRELARRPPGSGNIEERLTAAQFALNNHNDEEAARIAGDVLNEDRSQDLAAYLLAVVAARRNDVDTALGHLREAIAINPECRLQARQDEEFDPLMDSDEFHALIEAPASPAASAAASPLRKPVRKTGR